MDDERDMRGGAVLSMSDQCSSDIGGGAVFPIRQAVT
jgi:hypothetical protein